MVDCNHRNSDYYNNMMVGIQDNDGFVDLDTIKCASFANIMVGPDHIVTITAQTDVFQNCGANQVITGLGSSTYYTQDVIRMTCSDVSGTSVSDNCTDLTITEEMQSGELDPQLTWPVQCPDGTPRMGAMVGINFRDDRSPKWTGIRCCYLV
ncbi:uncharacterized protein LOC122391532 [Amphibalanus amphitrite]|uniref:uncharacterized protein LOC122391532 n=1 Tax=Amphibalanus amphitrite TaxID=1232801 RepID=UPI001C91C83E|nr:uncharacterized protein LOC122391532 [Amphibalanus amphitrite]